MVFISQCKALVRNIIRAEPDFLVARFGTKMEIPFHHKNIR